MTREKNRSRAAFVCWALTVLALLPAAASSTDSKALLTDAEVAAAVKMLDETEAQFLKLLEGVEGEAWAFKPGADRWSVGECAEHIVRSEAAMFDVARTSIIGGPDPEWEEKTAAKTATLTMALPNRTTRVMAPQEIRPTSGLDKARVIALFKANRAAMRELVEARSIALKAYLADNPFFGPLNAHQWLIYGPLHTQRHMKQIEEVMASDGYPGS